MLFFAGLQFADEERRPVRVRVGFEAGGRMSFYVVVEITQNFEDSAFFRGLFSSHLRIFVEMVSVRWCSSAIDLPESPKIIAPIAPAEMFTHFLAYAACVRCILLFYLGDVVHVIRDVPDSSSFNPKKVHCSRTRSIWFMFATTTPTRQTCHPAIPVSRGAVSVWRRIRIGSHQQQSINSSFFVFRATSSTPCGLWTELSSCVGAAGVRATTRSLSSLFNSFATGITASPTRMNDEHKSACSSRYVIRSKHAVELTVVRHNIKLKRHSCMCRLPTTCVVVHSRKLQIFVESA